MKIDFEKAVEMLLRNKYYQHQKDKNLFDRDSDGFQDWLVYNELVCKNSK